MSAHFGRRRKRSVPEAALIALGFGVITGVVSLCAMPAALISPAEWTPWFARCWARLVLGWSGVKVELQSEVEIPERPIMVVMANHTSHFDVASLYASLPFRVRPVAKRELTWIPIFGWVLAMGAAIIIDRGRRRKAIASIERAGREIARGSSVMMFPEGTRTPPGVLGPLKKGPFHLALAAHVPVLPIGVEGTGEILAKGDWRIHPGTVAIRIGTPIPVDDVIDDDAGRQALMGRVKEALARLGHLQ